MEKGKSTSKNKKKNRPASSSAITKEQFVSTMTPLIDLEKGAELSVSMCSAETRSLDSAQKKGSTILNLKCVDVQGLFTSFRFYVQTGLMGKTLLEFQSNKGDILPPHKFGTHDIVVLKPSKAVLGCPALGQGVVYRLKDSSITVAFDDVLEEGLNNPLRLEKLVTYRRMKDTLIQLSKGVLKGPASNLVPVLFGERQPTMSKKDVNFTPLNRNLDHSQSLGTQGYGLVVNEVGENQVLSSNSSRDKNRDKNTRVPHRKRNGQFVSLYGFGQSFPHELAFGVELDRRSILYMLLRHRKESRAIKIAFVSEDDIGVNLQSLPFDEDHVDINVDNIGVLPGVYLNNGMAEELSYSNHEDHKMVDAVENILMLPGENILNLQEKLNQRKASPNKKLKRERKLLEFGVVLGEFYRPCDRKIRKELLRELAAINGIMAQPWTVGEITMLLVILYAIPIPTHILTFPLKLVYRRHMYQACMDVTNMRIGEGLGDDICKKTDKDCFGRLGDLN
ncbi:hypothetical protein FXO38_34602 [Capsicum annuum]|nr:hypothetical protein FXO38_34602 [Capsicum annuum]KAF3621771.1 hypothetical protein FXO37_32606 [Capsicum annuum]